MMYEGEDVNYVSYWPNQETVEEMDERIRFYRKGLIVTFLVLTALTPVLAWLDSLHLSERLP